MQGNVVLLCIDRLWRLKSLMRAKLILQGLHFPGFSFGFFLWLVGFCFGPNSVLRARLRLEDGAVCSRCISWDTKGSWSGVGTGEFIVFSLNLPVSDVVMVVWCWGRERWELVWCEAFPSGPLSLLWFEDGVAWIYGTIKRLEAVRVWCTYPTTPHLLKPPSLWLLEDGVSSSCITWGSLGSSSSGGAWVFTLVFTPYRYLTGSDMVDVVEKCRCLLLCDDNGRQSSGYQSQIHL